MSNVNYIATEGLKLLGSEVGAWLADTTAETVVGSELASPIDLTTSWLTTGLATINDANTFTTTGAGGVYIADLGLVVGKKYILDITTTTTAATLEIRNDNAGVGSAELIGSDDGAFSFTALTTGLYFRNTDAGATDIDLISLRISDNDLSTNDHDLAYYGSITKSAVADGSSVMGYSGFSASDYLEQTYDSALDLTSELTYIGWTKSSTLNTETIIANYETGADDGGAWLYQRTNGAARFSVIDDAGSAVSATGLIDRADGQWHLFIGTLDTAGNIKIYVDGVLEATTSSATVGATTTGLRVGLRPDGTSPHSGSIASARVLPSALTAAQIKTIYDSEKAMFKANSVFTQVGLSYDLALSVTSAQLSESVQSSNPISIGGNQETIFGRRDTFFALRIIRLTASLLPALRNFLHSVEKGETFTLDRYGSAAAPDDPIDVIATPGFTEARQGVDDYYTVSINVRQVP